MPSKPTGATPHPYRLDAVALALLVSGGLLTASVASYRPLTGTDNWLGPVGDELAVLLVDPLGWGVAVFLAGWFAWTGLFVVNRAPGLLAVRLLGWVILTLSAVVAVDWYGGGLARPSLAGPGGSIGAYLRFGLEEALDPLTAPVALGGSFLTGLLFVAGWLVAALLRGVWAVVRTLWQIAVWGNDRVADGSAAVVTGLSVVARLLGRGLGRVLRIARVATGRASAPSASAQAAAASAQAAAASAQRPAVPAPPRVPGDSPLAIDPAPAAGASEPTPVEDIPIHTHTGPTPVPLLRAAPSGEEKPATCPHDEYELPPLTLLNDPEPYPVEDHQQKLREMAALLEKTCQDFGINIKVVGIHTGPVITQYEVALETGLRLNKVTTLADDLALNLRVPSVRVVAPLPGRNTVGIEVPNEVRQTVRLKEVVAALAASPKVAKYKLPLFIGKDVEGRPLAFDLAAMPHLLIAGRTGTGKSVCLNAIIISLLLTRRPDEARLILIDPKKVELSDYAHIPHLMTPVVKDVKKAEAILAWAVDKMEERYEWLHRARVRNIASYNDLPFEEVVRRVNPDGEDELRNIPRKMPYIVIVIDEVADLIMQMKKEIESSIILLAQKSRAAGIHLILATQKPTVDVITGLIKSNLPARICFQVNSRSDSAVVLDEKGAEKLLGMGDMLLLQQGVMLRAQGAFVDDREIERVVTAIATDTPNYDSELLNLRTRDQKEPGETGGGELGERLRDRDPLYEQAVEIVIREQRGSTSLLQRALGIGYGKASRFIDFMAEDGIVGPYNGSNARQVLVTPEEWEGRRRAAG
jgi:S-DNA-T family DNA segregation ATPase FtsK/SpoIIIE